MIAHNPLHGSGQAGFPHPALALGDNAHAAQGIGMTDGRQRQPASDEAPHAIPEDASVLATPRQRAMPEPSHLESKESQRRVVHGHSVIPEVSTHHRLQPFALFGNGFVHPSSKLGFHLVQLRLQPFADRLPQHRVHSVAPLLHADMREAEKVECLGLPFSTPLPVVDRKRTKFQQPRFLGMQFQVELPHSFREFRPELFGIRFALESNHDIVSESHDDNIAVRPLLTPHLDPQVEHVMKIDVRQKRRSTSALRRSFLHPYSFPILQHAGVQPFLDQPHDAPIGHPMLDLDIKSFFDGLSHEWLVKFIEHRVADRRVVRLIQKWLNAGGREDGKGIRVEEGTPQGGSASPLLANVYLHYVFDLWIQVWRQKRAHGDVIVVRFADDIVVGFQSKGDAEQFRAELTERMRKFHLELHPEKTRLLEFGPFAINNRQRRGEGKPETFNFLGFTHICVKKRSNGMYTVLRQTIRKRLQTKLNEVKAELRRRMHEPIPKQGKWLQAVVRGHLRYYGVPMNNPALALFRFQVGRLWHRSLSRRSQNGRVLWDRMRRLIARWLPLPTVCHPYPLRRMGVIT